MMLLEMDMESDDLFEEDDDEDENDDDDYYDVLPVFRNSAFRFPPRMGFRQVSLRTGSLLDLPAAFPSGRYVRLVRAYVAADPDHRASVRKRFCTSLKSQDTKQVRENE